MQKLGFKHLLQQKLSPQQIQFIKMLQLSTAEMESRVEEELEENTVDFGLEGGNPDCRIFLAHAVTTLTWLKSHHLLVT